MRSQSIFTSDFEDLGQPYATDDVEERLVEKPMRRAPDWSLQVGLAPRPLRFPKECSFSRLFEVHVGSITPFPIAMAIYEALLPSSIETFVDEGRMERKTFQSTDPWPLKLWDLGFRFVSR